MRLFIAYYTKKGKEAEYRIKAKTTNVAWTKALMWADKHGYHHDLIELEEVT